MTADSARMRSELPRRPRDWRRELGHRAFDGELLCSIVRPTIATPPSICREDDWYRSRGMGGSSVLFSAICIHTHTHVFNGHLSGTTRVIRYQKGKTNLDFTEARDSEWQWHQLGHMQVCTSLQTDNHSRTPPLSLFTCRPDALPAAQPTASKL